MPAFMMFGARFTVLTVGSRHQRRGATMAITVDCYRADWTSGQWRNEHMTFLLTSSCANTTGRNHRRFHRRLLTWSDRRATNTGRCCKPRAQREVWKPRSEPERRPARAAGPVAAAVLSDRLRHNGLVPGHGPEVFVRLFGAIQRGRGGDAGYGRRALKAVDRRSSIDGHTHTCTYDATASTKLHQGARGGRQGRLEQRDRRQGTDDRRSQIRRTTSSRSTWTQRPPKVALLS